MRKNQRKKTTTTRPFGICLIERQVLCRNEKKKSNNEQINTSKKMYRFAQFTTTIRTNSHIKVNDLYIHDITIITNNKREAKFI